MADRERRRRCSESTDMLSQLPQPLLHHILSFLSQKEAIQTCVLSKSWRYLGSTRPNLEFREHEYYGDKQTFLSVVDKTLHGYDNEKKLCVQEFLVEMDSIDPESVSLLEKWIPIIVLKMGGVKTFDLSFYLPESSYFDLPSVLFKAKSLQKLCLQLCRLSQNSTDKVHFKHLKTLSLTQVYIADETFQKIMSSCLFIEHVVLHGCEGLTAIRLVNNNYLKHFDIQKYVRIGRLQDYICFEIISSVVTTLETISIGRCSWYDHHHHMSFPRLKSLYLKNVRLSTWSFDILSCDFPCLQDLSIDYCWGFKELRLSNRSIKNLTISGLNKSMEASIDAPNIAKFVYRSTIPRSISFTTTSSEWKSSISKWCGADLDDDHAMSSQFLELNKLLEAVSQSEISLSLFQFCSPTFQNRRMNQQIEQADDDDIICSGGGGGGPVLVEYLRLSISRHSFSSFPALFIHMFRFCRPRNIRHYWFANPLDESQWAGTRVTEFLCKTLLMETEGRRYSWQHDLERASLEVLDQNSKEWHSVDGASFLESAAQLFPNTHELCFKLKWRE